MLKQLIVTALFRPEQCDEMAMHDKCSDVMAMHDKCSEAMAMHDKRSDAMVLYCKRCTLLTDFVHCTTDMNFVGEYLVLC